MRRLPLARWALLTLPALAACGDAADPGLDPTFSAIQEAVFDRRCSQPICHSQESHQGGLVLLPDVAYEQLVGVDAVMAPGRKRVVPGDPDASFLLDKVRPGLPSDQGGVMPMGSATGLPADEVTALRAWIRAGAKND